MPRAGAPRGARARTARVQRAPSHLLALLAGAATLLLVLARRCAPGLYAAGGWGLALATVLLAAWIIRSLGRRWLSRAGTPLWIDRHARLEGRLATALELERRGAAR